MCLAQENYFLIWNAFSNSQSRIEETCDSPGIAIFNDSPGIAMFNEHRTRDLIDIQLCSTSIKHVTCRGRKALRN
jgi:hypothetical protein